MASIFFFFDKKQGLNIVVVDHQVNLYLMFLFLLFLAISAIILQQRSMESIQ